MAQVAPNTTIPAPRVAFVDARTGLISKEWFLFLQNIFVRTGHGSIVDTVEDVQVSITSNVQEAQVAELRKELDGLYAVVATQEAQVAELIKTLQGLELVPTMPPDGETDSVVVGPGTETEPSISTVVDTNTGVYFPTDNALAITTDGVERIRVRANGDVAINALAKLYFDGAKATGDTYIVESTGGELSIHTNGAEVARFTPAYSRLLTSGIESFILADNYVQFKVSGSESLLMAPGLTTFKINGTTAMEIAPGGSLLLGGAIYPGAGFNGTATPPASITVVNGIVTNMT